MAKIKELLEKIETFAPIETQEEWDNSGWQICLGKKEAENIMLALNVTEDVINQAIEKNCSLIISHHPMIFGGLKCIKNKAIIKAIQNNIEVYSIHTNFDKAKNGTTETLKNLLEKELELTNIKDINGFVKCGKLKNETDTKLFIEKIKKALSIKTLKISKPKGKIKNIAICAGSGAEFVSELLQHNVDCYITADIKYHQALDCKFMLIDIGHFESEIISIPSMEKMLKMPNLNIFIAKEEAIFETI